MAQLYFHYGAMSSSKSANLLMVAHNYRSQGKKVILMTPSVDDRDGVGVISSRTGMKEDAMIIEKDMSIYYLIERSLINDDRHIHCILIDEAQFLSKEQVYELTRVVDRLNIPVMTYGLKNDFQNNLFEGSEQLLLHADKIIEIKTICSKESCGKKAVMNLRLNNGKPVYEGEQIQIGDEEYKPVCRRHYFDY